MNKTELIAVVAEKAELSKKDAEKAIKAFTDAVSIMAANLSSFNASGGIS